jgi:hypothetical protein
VRTWRRPISRADYRDPASARPVFAPLLKKKFGAKVKAVPSSVIE